MGCEGGVYGGNRRAYWILVEKLKEKAHFQNLGVDGRIILEKISVGRVSTGLIWFRIKANYGVSWKR